MKMPLLLEDLPFCLGAFDTPYNPSGLPAVLPFKIEIDLQSGMLSQVQDKKLDGILQKAYAVGALMGTPLSDSVLGIGYAEDFLNFIESKTAQKGRALEIGAGVGYISSQLKKAGWTIDSLEPGVGYEHYWKKYDVDVITEFFPSERARGPYNLIVAYAVMEHIADIERFLGDIKAHLTPAGIFILAVPDCTSEIMTGDPSMLLHEHFHYFNTSNLRRCLAKNGFNAKIGKAAYGRVLYAVSSVGVNIEVAVDVAEQEMLESYPFRCRKLISHVQTRLETAVASGSVGIYCPARALALLSRDYSLRFFDDAPELNGKYYPPFNNRISSREDLYHTPPDELWIMSRTFGKKIKRELMPNIPKTQVVLVEDLFE